MSVRGFRPSALQGELRFLCIAGLLLTASGAAVISMSFAMPSMDGMAMSAGWALPAAPPSGRSWLIDAPAFLAMWLLMMALMMGPSLVPVLWRCRRDGDPPGKADATRALVAAGYFMLWGALGLCAFAIQAVISAVGVQQLGLLTAGPFRTAAAMLLAGVVQFTGWKARRLSACARLPRTDARSWGAVRFGVLLGLRCCACCANLMVVLLVVGVMDLAAMAFVTATVTLERVARGGVWFARAAGALLIAGGLVSIAIRI